MRLWSDDYGFSSKIYPPKESYSSPVLLRATTAFSRNNPPTPHIVHFTLPLCSQSSWGDRCIPALLNMATRHCSQLCRYPWIINHRRTAQQLQAQAQRKQKAQGSRGGGKRNPVMESLRFSLQLDGDAERGRPQLCFSFLFSDSANVPGFFLSWLWFFCSFRV